MDFDLWFEFIENKAIFKYVNQTLACFRAYKGTKTDQNKHILNELLNINTKSRFNINRNRSFYKLLYGLMRLRTLMYHLLYFRFKYIFKDVRKSTSL